ncbi:MAG: Gfo/Idh/MocA family oxidoreductase [Planctomycetes bacterium]|nr:Gfo/Idh/MocA family oxidoreductase [Planctomycetota bacterium]
MEPIKLGIIGVGQIGKRHLDRYADIPGAEMVAAADIDEEELNRVADLHDIQHRYTDFRKLLERDDIDAVDVCLHNNYHMPVTVEALRAGKNVYCEKPMAGSYTDALRMLRTAEECNQKLSIQLFSLFSKETRIGKHLINEGHLGDIYHARSTGYRRRGRPYVDGYGTETFVQKKTAAGGALYDMGVYHIAQILYLIGLPEVERISGKIYQKLDMDAERREKSGYDVEELGLGFVKCEDELTIDIMESWAIHLDPFEGSCVVGTEGGLRLNPFSFHTTMSDVEADTTFDLNGTSTRWHRLRADEDAYDSSQHHWIAALQGRVDLLPTAKVALRTMLISEGIYLSDRLGREVSAAEVVEASESTAVEI